MYGPNKKNYTFIAEPIFRSDGTCEGWFKFEDNYLRPEVLYGSWPPLTTLKLGGRLLIVDRPVCTKLVLKNSKQDYYNWTERQQHSDFVNLSVFHRDFSDVDVAYSLSSPQTHVWFNRYSIHFDAFENLTLSSYNTTIYVRPENIPFRNNSNEKTEINFTENNSASPIPCNTVQIPHTCVGTDGQEVTSYYYTAQHLNDCERPIQIRDQYTIDVGVSTKSSPFSNPPVYPPLDPFSSPANSSLKNFNTVQKENQRILKVPFSPQKHNGRKYRNCLCFSSQSSSCNNQNSETSPLKLLSKNVYFSNNTAIPKMRSAAQYTPSTNITQPHNFNTRPQLTHQFSTNSSKLATIAPSMLSNTYYIPACSPYSMKSFQSRGESFLPTAATSLILNATPTTVSP